MAMSFLDGILGAGASAVFGRGSYRQPEPDLQTYLDNRRIQASSPVDRAIAKYQQTQALQSERLGALLAKQQTSSKGPGLQLRVMPPETKEKVTARADSSKSLMPVVDLKPRRKIVFTDE